MVFFGDENAFMLLEFNDFLDGSPSIILLLNPFESNFSSL